jgi:hypothetical protein
MHKRQIDMFTRMNILYGSRLSKLLVVFALMIIAILSNKYPVYSANSLFFIVLAVLSYGVIFRNYFKNLGLLQNGVITKGKFHSKEDTRFYNQGPSGNNYFCKYLFSFKDSEGKQNELLKWTTRDSKFDGAKKIDMLYDRKNPANALVISLVQGGPYWVDDDRIMGRPRVANILNALLTTLGIVYLFFYLS